MKLPTNAVGISDILQYRACPQQFAWQMRRHVPLPAHLQSYEGEKDDPPENEAYASAYGSAIHDAIALVDRDGLSDEQAIDAVWVTYQHWLEPGDIDRLRADLETFHTRTSLGWRVIAVEEDMRVPLLVRDGETIFFRFKVDALYQHMDNAALFLSRDYKSSRWPKSAKEVHADIQQWSYNWALHERFPEIGTLIQQYDQLRYGSIPTGKNDGQRRTIRDWLVKQVTAILDDDAVVPKQNDKCQWCPLVMECRETHRSVDYWKAHLAAVAPEGKDGRKTVVDLAAEPFESHVERLPKAKETLKILERYVGTVEADLKAMPEERRGDLGYELSKPKRIKSFSADAKRQIFGLVGDAFFSMASLSQTAVEEFFGSGPDAQEITRLASENQGARTLRKRKP